MSRAAWPVAHGEHSTRVLQLQPSQPRGTTTWGWGPQLGLQGGNAQKRSRVRGKAAMGCHGVGTAFVFNTFLSFKAVTDIAGALVQDSGHC